MYSDEPMSTDKTSKAGCDANINPPSHLCLIDDEAEVSGEVGGIQNGDTAPGAFPQFMQLPPELRHQIWHFYCPDLIVEARVLPVLNWPGSTVPYRQTNSSMPAYHLLEDQTRNLRATLSTHRESRSIAVRKYPDELIMNAAPGTSIVRFRKETDVILLKELSTNMSHSVPDFGKQIQNLAVETVLDSEERYEEEDLLLKALPALKGLFPNLKRLFSYDPTQTWLPSRSEWFTLECVQWYMVNTYCGRKPGLGDHTGTLFCWPDLDTYPDLVRSFMPNICSLKTMDKAGVEFWPIVGFGSEISMEVYDMMRRQYWPSSAKCDDSSDSDEYDSEAIDHDNDVIDHDEVLELLASSKVELSPGEIEVFSSLSNEIG
ncbi:hypothetical protein E4U40_000518 [Claviceps sp. LM458 group G5]|nr:hypothetical protein E4U40_000518 [Claviceps sp. LM458 group G5]